MSDARVWELLHERDGLLTQLHETRALLAAAARGELPRCVTCGDRLALRQWEGTPDAVCDVCYVEGEAESLATGEPYDPAGCVDLPYAAALRAAMDNKESDR